ncbi:hypothetical protein [Hydrogenophaga sp. NFH-34]|uniref:hypothetical protein n=1 Tax=Hydrogenophaga sp. NFH-34 TaxID=2744446 RepID=UPI001F35A315|nr:hypothetical protein [Hydrogenophaga sp. NFH-34]
MKRLTAQDYKAMYSTPTGMALIIYFVLTVLIGMFIPSDILTANAWAREFSDFMASIVPQIDRVTSLGIKSDINRFYFSLLWGLSPFLFVMSALVVWSERKRGYPVWSAPLNKTILPILFGIFIFALSLWGYGLLDIDSKMVCRILNSIWGRSFMGNLLFVASPVGVIGGVSAISYGWLSGYIPKNIHEQEIRKNA